MCRGHSCEEAMSLWDAIRRGLGFTPTPNPLQEQVQAAEGRVRLQKLKLEEAALQESMSSIGGLSWGIPWSDLADPYFQGRPGPGGYWTPLGAGSLSARQAGRHRPFIWTDFC